MRIQVRQMMSLVRLFICMCVHFTGLSQASVLRKKLEIDKIVDLDQDYLTFSGNHEDDAQYYFRLEKNGSYRPLYRHHNIDLNSPLCYVENGAVVCEQGNHQDTQFYTDSDHSVAVAISNERGLLKMKGVVNTHNSSIELDPLDGDGLPSNRYHVIKKRWTANIIPHVREKRGTRRSKQKLNVRKNKTNRRVGMSRGRKFKKPKASPYKTIPEETSPGTYCINILCVVDYSIYKKYLASERTSSRAIQKIRFYYAHVINGINMRYATITQKGFRIKIRLAGYFIAKRPNDLRFIDSGRMAADPSYRVDSNYTLTELDIFLKSLGKSSALPAYNHAMLFLEYASNNLGGSVLGTSFVSGICSDSKGTSLVVDLGGYTSAGIGTHELGHNLGVFYHDGEGTARSTSCNASRNYIMAPASFLIDNKNLKYSFTFSSCSISQMKRHIDNLIRANRNCLKCSLQGRSSFSEIRMDKEVQGHLTKLPGLVDDVHAQCIQLYGKGSFMCPPASTDEMCYRMYCYDPKRGACAIISEQMAAPGTPCGKFKVCKMGQCVVDTTNGKDVPDDCPYPDILSKEAHCEDAMPFLCSNPKFKQKCCSSCNKKFTPEESCKDTHTIINGQPCAQLVRSAIGPAACSGDYKVQQLCCQSCKATKGRNYVQVFSKPPRQKPGGGRCKDSTVIRINSKSCADLVATNDAYCQGCKIQEICCKSCSPYLKRYRVCQ